MITEFGRNRPIQPVPGQLDQWMLLTKLSRYKFLLPGVGASSIVATTHRQNLAKNVALSAR